MEDALKGADMFLGLSVAGALKVEWIKGMKDKAIIFALANPKAEVAPEEAEKLDNVAVIATGSSAYANQVNNALVFPGMFRGALDARITEMTRRAQDGACQSACRRGLARSTVRRVHPAGCLRPARSQGGR